MEGMWYFVFLFYCLVEWGLIFEEFIGCQNSIKNPKGSGELSTKNSQYWILSSTKMYTRGREIWKYWRFHSRGLKQDAQHFLFLISLEALFLGFSQSILIKRAHLSEQKRYNKLCDASLVWHSWVLCGKYFMQPIKRMLSNCRCYTPEIMARNGTGTHSWVTTAKIRLFCWGLVFCSTFSSF